MLMTDNFSPTVYILASHRYGTLYTGVTSNLMKRLYEHRNDVMEGFSKDKGTKLLVWFESHNDMKQAIIREKRIKKWKRQWKINLIEAGNPDWRDLAMDLGFDKTASTRLKQ